ncbi:Hint domain-containing protein [Runella salmonicolor]|uniref:Hint domain-containing protein n=1 Tax=Runella salmonicolor TaxID=2950278 RepID=A0ABT1FSC6_9BACT|nr:Hint domain-containing protein [Runella salmonicolor]MCP1384660.1 hypothetical protein [Runella salmonicolor]
MKSIIILFLAACTSVLAQNNMRAITLDEYAKVKALSLKSVEKHTYIREKGYVFDRPEGADGLFEFNLNDGIERKIYLYKISEGTAMNGIGTLAVFSTQGKQIKLYIPNQLAPKEVWNQYMSDLKVGNTMANGFAVCVAYMLSQLKTESAPDSTSAEVKDPNDFCFPAETFVNLADGSEKPISSITEGEMLSGIFQGKVKQIEIHEGRFTLTRLLIKPHGQAWVSAKVRDGLIALEATATHPLLTLTGRKKINQLQVGDWVFVRDAVSGRFVTAEISVIQHAVRTVTHVYNLRTESGTYETESIIALDKN